MSRSLWLTLPLLLCAAPLAAQAPAVESVTCLSPCDRVPRPVGQYVHGVELGGRFVTLEDGSVWEVEYSDRATVASWTADDFVRISFISAPRGDFEYLLTRAGDHDQQAAARLHGRARGQRRQGRVGQGRLRCARREAGCVGTPLAVQTLAVTVPPPRPAH